MTIFGFFFRTISTASATFFEIGCGADPKLENASMPTFGSAPKLVARSAASSAISASSSALGEMHLDTAVVEEIVTKNYPHSRIKGDANVLIFPDLTSGNIGYKLVQRLGGADALGPILLGVRKPVNVLQHGMTVADIVNVAAITAMSAE